MHKIVTKTDYDNKSNTTIDIQDHFKTRFIDTINKSIKNSILVISYRELLTEGMAEDTFYNVINMYTSNGGKVHIKEFDIELY